MAKKTILGVDIGHDRLKLALVRGARVLKTASADMPENLLKEGRISSRETMGELIHNTMKKNGIRAGHAAFVLPNETVFVKNVEMPMMTIDQLLYNLPFEFNDYITGELKEYIFDYAVVSDPVEPKPAKADKAPAETPAEPPAEGGETEEKKEILELMAVGAQRAILEDVQATLRKAGLKLIRTAPAISAYIELIRAQHESLKQVGEEYGILDLGYTSIRLYMFKGDRHIATRALEMGLSTLDDAISDAFGVEAHLAHTYLMSNYENCQDREECHTAYDNIAVELMRALNFYRFSNPNSALGDMWVCGGGAMIRPLVESIGGMLGITLHTADELVPGGERVNECNNYAQAIGIAMT